MVIEESDEDKRLITAEVLSEGSEYKKGSTIIFGKYSIFPLTLQGEDFFFIDEQDIIATTTYNE